jgi:hypothetical protein
LKHFELTEALTKVLVFCVILFGNGRTIPTILGNFLEENVNVPQLPSLGPTSTPKVQRLYIPDVSQLINP